MLLDFIELSNLKFSIATGFGLIPDHIFSQAFPKYNSITTLESFANELCYWTTRYAMCCAMYILKQSGT